MRIQRKDPLGQSHQKVMKRPRRRRVSTKLVINLKKTTCCILLVIFLVQ